jgi:hypothetical protein
VVAETLERLDLPEPTSLEAVLACDTEARREAETQASRRPAAGT